jgi:purine-cytosine permease-like protein
LFDWHFAAPPFLAGIMKPKVRIGKNHIELPRSALVRIVIGLALIVGGLLGFLPVLGFWMIPLGLLVLSVDLPIVRRWRRQLFVWWERRVRGNGKGRGPNAGRPDMDG